MSNKRHKSHKDENFFFHAYRNDLTRLVEKFNTVLEDSNDFWKFVQKYEDVERKKLTSDVGTRSKPENSSNFFLKNVLYLC